MEDFFFIEFERTYGMPLAEYTARHQKDEGFAGWEDVVAWRAAVATKETLTRKLWISN